MINFKYMSGKLTKTLKFGHKNGLHIRPAQVIKELAEILLSEIKLQKREAVIDLKKDGITDFILLELKKDDEIILIVEGEDKDEALDVMVHIFSRDILNKDNDHEKEIEIIKNKNWKENIKEIIISHILKNK